MIKKIIKWWLIVKISTAVLFILFYFISSNIIINKNDNMRKWWCTNHNILCNDQVIYLQDNGRHIDIIIKEDDKYVGYGWGSEVFYLNVPTWDDLTVKVACQALFTKPSSVMHITYHDQVKDNWIKVDISSEQLNKMKELISKSFKTIKGERVFKSNGYTSNDIFYEANGNYSIFKTCNTWSNSILKNSGLKSLLWTPFSSDISQLYE